MALDAVERVAAEGPEGAKPILGAVTNEVGTDVGFR